MSWNHPQIPTEADCGTGPAPNPPAQSAIVQPAPGGERAVLCSNAECAAGSQAREPPGGGHWTSMRARGPGFEMAELDILKATQPPGDAIG